MSGIVLSSSVRQNLLSLQSTAALLATTQNDLATGNAVNSALDNPTNYFTAQGLNNRASDIGNLLDSIGNGVQVLQAANTGITSLQSLISSAQSIANQVLQTPVGYSTKSNVTSAALTGATADNLLGSTGAATNASAVATTALATITSTSTAPTSGTVTAGAFTAIDVSGGTGGTASTLTGTVDLSAGLTDGGADQTFTIDGHAVTLATGTGTGTGTAPTKAFTLSDIEGAINGTTGIDVTASISGNNLVLTSKTNGTTGITVTAGATATAIFGATPGTTTGTANTTLASESFSLTVDGGTAKTITIDAAHISTFNSDAANASNQLDPANLSAANVASLINYEAGSTVASGASGKLVFTSATTGTTSSIATGAVTVAGGATGGTGVTATSNSGLAHAAGADLTFKVNNTTVTLAAGPSYTAAQVAAAINGQVAGVNASVDSTGKLSITSTGTAGAADQVKLSNFSSGDATQLGFANATETDNGTDATGGLSGETLVIGATGGGTATSITFGTAKGDVSTLNELNAALAGNNLQATLNSSTGQLNITTSNNAASATIGAITGTATATGSAFAGATAADPVLDPNSQATRASLVSQYNNVLQQINTTSQDSSFNGINLLNGDTLKLVFNETGTSTLSITGVTFSSAGLGLSALNTGTDFLDNASANSVLTQLQAASSTLSTEASTLGSNLSIVQVRQDFNKNLINVLQTGASNLTLADPNQEAANSQALSTRQSIAVSALALANQSQESVLQLLR
jgi:flagellin